MQCDFVAGCDGFHGVCREVIPAARRREFAREYPFAWLGVLAQVAPSTDELIYAYHERGFALHSMRSPELSRLYVQVRPDEGLSAWPDERIWDELRLRLASEGFALHEGPIIERSIATMRSFVCEPMQHGRLFLAGDAAHIVPPTGAKGMNLALADVAVLSSAFARWFDTGDRGALDAYSETCLQRVWRVQDFSILMTELMHRLPDADPLRLGGATSAPALPRRLGSHAHHDRRELRGPAHRLSDRRPVRTGRAALVVRRPPLHLGGAP